jgi:hypothetical protein
MWRHNNALASRVFVMIAILTGLDTKLRPVVRMAVLPLLQAPEEALMGGQAVIEGVMMRSPHSYAVAVRQPSGLRSAILG